MNKAKNKTTKVAILTGAGISQESGISTFRDQNGLWENHAIEEVATLKGFEINPSLVLEFYNKRRAQLKEVEPNDAHRAIKKLDEKLDVSLITQNVDDLHQRTKLLNIYPMHGELKKARCTQCHHICDLENDITTHDICENCETTGKLRPHIVWFGEIPLYMDKIHGILNSCDYFLSIGTGLEVHPAAGFVEIAKNSGAKCIELNLERTSYSHFFHESIRGKAGEIVPPYIDKLLTVKINK